MKNDFNKTQSITSGFVAAVLVAAIGVVLPAMAWADDSERLTQQGDDREIETLQFERSIELDDDSPLEMQMFRLAEAIRPVWHVAIHDEQRDDPVCRSTLPGEAGRNYYDYHIETVDDDEGHVVLLQVRADHDDAPLDPTEYQLAFYLRERGGQQTFSCTLIGRGERTELDGGAHLAVEEVDGQPRLVRHGDRDQPEFCGIQDDEQHGFEVFDAQAGRFVSAADVDISEADAEPLDASVPAESPGPPLTEDYYAWLSASSDIRGAPLGAAVPRPRSLEELDIESGWVEGADELGVGEFVTAGVNTAARLEGLQIFPGHGASREAFEGHARPTRLLVALGDGQRFSVEVPQQSFDEFVDGGGLFVELPEPTRTECVSVKILDAQPGAFAGEADADQRRLGNSVAIAEITLYSTVDGEDEATTADQIIEAIGEESSPARRDQLARLGALIPEAMVEAISERLHDPEIDEQVRVRIVPLLGGYDYQQSLPVLESHFRRMSPDQEDYRHTKRALAQHGSVAAPALLALLEDLEPDDDKHVDTIRIIGRIGSEVHLRGLIEGLGEGESMLRGERIRALTHGGIELAPELVEAARSQGDNAAGRDALTALVFIGRRHFRHELGQFDDVEQLQTIYSDSSSRAHRIRAIEAMGYFELPDAEQFLGEQLLEDDPDPVIRQFAAAALKRYPGDQIRRQLQTALGDDSPDVRIAAVRALSRRDDATEATDAVVEYVESGRAWPQGLHHGLRLLAESTDPAAHRALAELIDDDPGDPAARTALRAMRRAEQPLEVDQIEQHLTAESTPVDVARQLIAMLGFAESEPATELLVQIAEGGFQPFEDHTEEQRHLLIRRAFHALGNTRTSEALEFLVATVEDDDRTMDHRGDALRALGFFSDPQVVEKLRQLGEQLPDELSGEFQTALTMVQNRLAVDETQEDIQFLIDWLDEEIDRREDPDDPPRPH